MSIRFKLFLPIVLAFIVLAGVMHFLWLPEMLAYEREAHINKEHAVLRALDQDLARSMLVSDYAAIYMTLNRQLNDEILKWKQVVLKKTDGTRIFPLTKPKILNGEYIISIDHTVRWDGLPIAKLHIDIDWQSEYEAQYQRVTQIELLALLIFTFIVYGAAIWQNRGILKPLKQLQEAAGRLAKGDYSMCLPDQGRDELGQLSNAFGKMRSNLEILQKGLQSALVLSQTSDTRSRAILDNMGDGLVIYNKQGVIELFNPAAERMFGYTADEVTGKNVSKLLPEFERKEYDVLIENSSLREENTGGWVRDLVGLRKDGSHFPMEINVAPIYTGNEEAFVGIVHDMSESKHAEEQLHVQREQLNDILENTENAYLTLDHNWNITYVNRVSETLLDINIDEVMGADFREVLPDMVSMFYKILHATFTTHEKQRTIVLYGPTMKYLEACTYPTESGVIIYFRDMTEQKSAENELVKAKDEAERANKAKSEFLCRMSHELRTPLNAILGFGQLLELDIEEEEPKQCAGEIVNAGNHLLELINEVLDLSRIESDKLVVKQEDISLNRMLGECLSLTRTLAERRSIRVIDNITPVTDHVIQVDHMRFKQVIINLLSNAVKYNKEAGLITLDCTSVNESCIRISVTDTGKGLSEKEQQQLFVPFERISGNEGIEGAGIGLVITRRLIELMGGRIGFESPSGQGSTFWVEILLAKDDALSSELDSSSIDYKVGH